MTPTTAGRAYLAAATVFLLAGPARAQEASPEMLQSALQAAISQRDSALNDGVRISAQLALAQREIARIRSELDEARKAAPAQPAPVKPAQ